jgi:hypothetical protein
MVSSGMLRRVALVRTDVSEETGASFIRVTRISELGTTQAATSNRRTLHHSSQRTSVFTAVTTKNAVFLDVKTQFVPRRKHITSPLQSPAG